VTTSRRKVTRDKPHLSTYYEVDTTHHDTGSLCTSKVWVPSGTSPSAVLPSTPQSSSPTAVESLQVRMGASAFTFAIDAFAPVHRRPVERERRERERERESWGYIEVNCNKSQHSQPTTST